MSTSLSRRVTLLGESETLAMSKKSLELKAQGKDVINLSLGEPDFFTPDFIKEKAKWAIDHNKSFYTPVAGTLELRKIISEKLLRENQIQFSPEQIVVSTGAKQAVANVVLALVDPEDEVVIPAPYWVSYKEIVEFAQGKVVSINCSAFADYKMTPAQLEAALTPKTKLFIFSNPSNPTGSVYTRDELNAFAQVFAKFPKTFILSDEIYEYINFGQMTCSLATFAELKERVIVINGVSKGFAMTGWRLGYLAAPLVIAKACEKIQGQFTSGTSAITQSAVCAALTTGSAAPEVESMRQEFKKRRDCFYQCLKEIPHLILPLPEGAFYLFPDVSWYFGKKFQDVTIKTSKDLSMYLLEEGLVGSTPGEAFGSPESVRFSYAVNENVLIEAAKRIKNVLEKLK
jgi:aspartate aminotransferase